MNLAPREQNLWAEAAKSRSAAVDTQAINEKYERGEQRIVTESNREKLQNFVGALARTGYMDLRPFYQRRARWDTARQSKLIESFIINIPVPPIFLYEKSFNAYEVMDGQQRITAISEFYANKFALEGLAIWPELNGMRYDDLPTKVKAGIDRRSISSIVLLKESAPDDEDAILLRQIVFERLNTGGVKLERQEIRNAIYQGPLNDALLELTRNELFRKAWGLPRYAPEELTNLSLPIHEIPFYSKMEDAEVVLRFFALRHASNFKWGMQGFLDLYMVKARAFAVEDVEFLKILFSDTITLADAIFGNLIFRPFDLAENSWSSKPHKAFYDAVMVSLAQHLSKRELLAARRSEIQEKIAQLFRQNPDGTFTGRANTKADVINRIDILEKLFASIT